MSLLRKMKKRIAGTFLGARKGSVRPEGSPGTGHPDSGGVPGAGSSPPGETLATGTHYRSLVTEFYAFLPDDIRQLFIDDALYHQKRYQDMLSLALEGEVIEVGSDKPFITHMLRVANERAAVHTMSIDIPHSPYPIIRIDIESEAFPFADRSISAVIFTEVLEHLFRDPAWTVHQISRVLSVGGMLFLTTPNACGYDCLVNFLSQTNPNGRAQFFEAVESGHPHLWTAGEVRMLLEANGFEVVELRTVDYYDVPCPDALRAFLSESSVDPALNGQVLRIIAKKVETPLAPSYPKELFPSGRPVQLTGALLRWIETGAREVRRHA